MTRTDFTEKVVASLRRLKRGRVATYGEVAAMAGNPRAARQVAWVLHAIAGKEKLPWHRVVNAQGRISLPRGGGYELQRSMLASEGIEFGPDDRIDLKRYGL